MQEQTNEQTTPTLPTSQPGAPVSLVEPSENDDDPDIIFLKAVAEIDTQPLVKVKPRRTGTVTIADMLEIGFLVSVLFCGLLGSAYLALTYPHTLVILYAKEHSATITVALALATRPLAPVTVTRSQTAPTTGTGHQDATQAVGQLTLYNAAFTPQTIQAGSVVFTGTNGVLILTNETVTLPANTPPQDGIASVTAHAQTKGSNGNIPAFAMNGQVSSSLYVKNLTSFTGGRDARDYRAVAQQDMQRLTATTTTIVHQAGLLAFTLRPGEIGHETSCTTKITADHAAGEEAATLTVTVSATCQGIAYSQDELHHKATAALTKTRPGANYHVIGSVLTTLQSVSPFTVTIHGNWIYTFSTAYEQTLAEQIQGESPKLAKAYLLKTGVIADASIPGKLPPVGYIDFLVLVG